MRGVEGELRLHGVAIIREVIMILGTPGAENLEAVVQGFV